MDKTIESRSQKVLEEKEEKIDHQDESPSVSSAGKAKIRYIAGARVHKIAKRLQESVSRKLSLSRQTELNDATA
ncbi:hypothetical protein KP79_PYT16794 [Mizuhopecten yessoensis]|uniref:Uncharacterized protein n=1 Tax=Mizuhopecten yessoensis TaxID=6573 RepID=A0A210PGB3_MIZYE|nr:hypothetical protein KP79_PYT16794 [Mizuhopecten yessoensis]